jgi:hypothetical protein
MWMGVHHLEEETKRMRCRVCVSERVSVSESVRGSTDPARIVLAQQLLVLNEQYGTVRTSTLHYTTGLSETRWCHNCTTLVQFTVPIG